MKQNWERLDFKGASGISSFRKNDLAPHPYVAIRILRKSFSPSVKLSDAEWTKYAENRDLGVEALHARYVTHHYEMHSHDYFVLGTVDHGAAEFKVRGSRKLAPASTAMIINAGDLHDGHPHDDNGYVYSMVYADAAVINSIAAKLGMPESREIEFTENVVADWRVTSALKNLHGAIMSANDAMATEHWLVETLSLLLPYYGHRESRSQERANHRALQIAKEVINDCFSERLTTADLAKSAGVSRVYLNHLFQTCERMPIHTYLTQVRMKAAKRLLQSGSPASEVAIEVGLGDQSHLIRRFKGTFGITPSKLAEGLSKIQYGA